jgi:CBS domain-containing protein
MTVGRICQREVDLAEIGESVQAAAQRMVQRQVGTLVILDESKKPVGILTDRDLVLRVLAEGKDARRTTVGEVMTDRVDSVGEETPIEKAVSVMRNGSFRRLPVVDGWGRLVGLVSLDDILGLLAEEFVGIGELLEKQTPRELARL